MVYLPSQIRPEVRRRLGLEVVAEKESECRKQLAVSCIHKIQEVVRNMGAMTSFKIAQDRRQDQNTRARTHLKAYYRIRDTLIQDYNRHRRALLNLGAIAENSLDFRELTLKDTYRKSTAMKRGVGDSHHRDGGLWSMGGGSTGYAETAGSENTAGAPQLPPVDFGTDDMRRMPSPRKRKRQDNDEGDDEKGKAKGKANGKIAHEDGWIWTRALQGEKEDEWELEREFFLSRRS